MSPTPILIVAGEVSGDIHAAPVVNELKRINPDLTFFGAGGDQMREAGVELLADVNDLAVMGFSQLPRILPKLSRLKKSILERVREQNVKLAILVDYPGFNLNLAKALKSLPDPPKVVCYIAPQVWAWRKGRVKKMRGVVDHLAVVFPFEVPIFRDGGIVTTFVGHPLIEELDEYMGVPLLLSKGGTEEISPTLHSRGGIKGGGCQTGTLLALLPGSRLQTMRVHLPIMLKAARQLQIENPGIAIGVGKAPGLDIELYRSILKDDCDSMLWDDGRKLLSSATAVAVCSGTATLEAALLGTPQVVVYHTSWLNYHIIKRLIQLDKIALVNIVAEKSIAPELIQNDLTPDKLANALEPLLTDSSVRNLQLAEMSHVKDKLAIGSGDEGSVAGQVAVICTKYIGLN